MHWTQPHQEWNLTTAGTATLKCARSRPSLILAVVFIISAFPFPSLGSPPSHPSGAGRKVGGAGYVTDYVDRIEINHVLDAGGAVTLDQVIFWDYSPSLAAFVVRDWRTLKTFEQLPYKRGLLYVAQWHDTRDSCGRKVVAGEVVETWTAYDAEVSNQEICDRNNRRGLTRPEKREVKK